MAKIKIYRTYRFIDKDPIIDKARTVLQDEKLIQRLGIVAEMSGVSRGTLVNWFSGGTKRPQFATLAAVATAVGYDLGFSKAKLLDINIEVELQKARDWNKKHPPVPRKPRKRKPKLRVVA